MRSKSKRSLLTLTPEEKRDIKKKKIDGRIKKMDRRQKFLENEADKLKTKMNQLISNVLSDSEEEEAMNEVI